MKKLFVTIMACLAVTCVMAQGWPANYGGVMLQGFYWDYYNYDEEMNSTGWATWKGLESHASELEGYIDLIWVPNSARTKNDYCVEHAATEGSGWLKDMGYMPCWWLNHDNTIFGSADELKSMISTYKSKGIGIIEDVVINHKNGQNDWCDFPDEHVVGTKGTYDLKWSLADICYNDNGGYVRTMFDVTGAADTGDDFDGCRDLDHTGANVQQNVKTYLDYLQKELGYAGFRYDMVKGYNPQYVGIYNTYAKPTFSVGECWDNWDGTTWWVNGTKQNGVVQSAAFDFPLKFLINQAFNGSFYQNALNTQGMAGSTEYQRYSVTFVDNHDTYRGESIPMNNPDNVLAANAFILSMPGTPCIFLPHWKAHKDVLKKMIAARKAAGITNQSSFTSDICNNGNGRQFTVTGSNAVVLLLLGNCGYEPSTDTYRSVCGGNNFKMYISKSVTAEALDARPSGSNANLGNARVDMASGYYYQTVTVNVSPSDDFTTLVYTEDGNDPTTDSPMITSTGKSFTYNTEGTHTLKVGVKGANSVTNIQTYNYTITNNIPTDITIYVRADKEPLYLYAWDANGTLTSAWPGTQLSEMKSADSQNFYYMTFPKPTEGYTLNYILNQGSDDTKSADNTNIGSTIFTALGEAGQKATDLTTIYSGTTISDPIEYEPITVYVKGDFGPAYLYTWDGFSTGAWPGTKMSTTLINGETWFYYTMPKNVRSFNMIVNKGNDSNKSNDYTSVNSTRYLQYNGHQQDLTVVEGMSEYPVDGWYEQGEICTFFVSNNDNGWDGSKNISAYVYNGETKYAGNWPGTDCTLLGFNENGDKIWKWNYDGASLPEGTIIIFTNKDSGSNQTANCVFKNGAWYNTSNTGDNTSPVSTAVAPSTEISVAALGKENPPTVTNWNGKSEKVAENDGTKNMTKDFSLAAGTYTVQAIVRGTSKSTLTLSAKGQSNEVTLTGLNGAESTVQTNGIVEAYSTGKNNGWQKAEVSFTLSSAEKVTVTLSSAATTWQLGALKMLPSTTKTKATTGVDLENNAYIDVRGVSEFSFFERGANPNALIKAAANTMPALLPYNVIVGNTCANLQLTDGNYSFMNAGDAFTATNVSYNRDFTVGNRSTICLPFALTAEEAAAAGTFWGLESYDSNTGNVSFVEVEEPQANVPYLFDPKTANPFSSFTNKEIPATTSLTVTEGVISFVGVNERTNLKSVENGVTYYGYRNNAFVEVGSGNGAWINPFRAYIRESSNAGARINVLFDGEETGIQVVKSAVEPKGEQPIYNLSGQRVQTPSMKGIYIKGGKKYIVK
jgi:alpha-amylase